MSWNMPHHLKDIDLTFQGDLTEPGKTNVSFKVFIWLFGALSSHLISVSFSLSTKPSNGQLLLARSSSQLTILMTGITPKIWYQLSKPHPKKILVQILISDIWFCSFLSCFLCQRAAFSFIYSTKDYSFLRLKNFPFLALDLW